MSETPNPTLHPETITGEKARDLAAAIIDTAANANNIQEYGFVPEETMYLYAGGERYVSPDLELRFDKPIDVPVHMFVGALGFDSWEGRSGGTQKDLKPSRAVIEDYASRETEIPGVDTGIQLFLDNDGNAFALSANSHRVAAARLKKQKTISVKGSVSIFHLRQTPPELHR